ncbi:MAG: hypothetical protein AB9919_12990 [Geobacteraceae bacterium]
MQERTVTMPPLQHPYFQLAGQRCWTINKVFHIHINRPSIRQSTAQNTGNCSEENERRLTSATKQTDDVKTISAGTQITLEEFSRLMKISKNTAYKWCKKYLVEGKHYLKLGSVIRVIYAPEMIVELQGNFNKSEKKDKREKAVMAARKQAVKQASPINWDY